MGAEECWESTLFKYESAGGLVVEAVLLAYLFYVMMVLTDEYLMGTWHIEYIDISIHKFHLSTTAGACLVLPTQIAFGSIVPEFTVNTISSLLVSKQHSILGLSTIIGSGCFAGMMHGKLTFPLMEVFKDYLTYLSLLVLVITIVADGEIKPIEAILLCAITPFYVLFSFRTPKNSLQSSNRLSELDSPAPVRTNNPLKYCLKRALGLCIPTYTGQTWQIVLSFTYIVTLGFGITRLTVFFLERMMCHTHVPESLVGLTIIAWGNNIGDLMNAAVAVKRGDALLSISSLLATQILNLVFSLGFPWALSTILFGSMTVSDKSTEYSLYFAVLIVALSFLAIASSGQRLHSKLGGCLLLLYVFYVGAEWTLLDLS